MGKYSILLVLGLSVVMFTYSFLLRNTFFSGNERVVEMYEFNQAHNIAQGALMTVIRDLNNGESSIDIPAAGGSSSTGFSNWPDMMGDYNIDIRHDAVQDLMIVESTGRFDGTEYTVTAGLRSSAAGFNWPDMDYALYTEDYLSINSGSQELSIGGDIPINANLYVENADLRLGNSGSLKGNIISGGENITIDGGSQNQSRLIYAPNANVTMGGFGTVLGAIAARSFSGSGGFKIDYSGDFENFLPELDSDDDSGRFTIAFWN